MNTNFAISLAHVLVTEGGRVDDSKDPGGRTNRGITQDTYNTWRREHGLPQCDVWGIDEAEIPQIYREHYWDKVNGDKLPSGVDYATFDFAVNSGVVRAINYLQHVASVQADGIIGPQTLAAVNDADPRRIVNGLCTMRLAFLQGLPGWQYFGDGWTNRVNTVETTARGMA